MYGIIPFVEEVVLTIAKPTKRTLIETISSGYRVLHQHLWVLFIPIVLNGYLWLGPRLSLAPFLGTIHHWLMAMVAMVVADPWQQEQLVVQIQNSDMRKPLAVINFIPLLPDHFFPAVALSDQIMYVRTLEGAVVALLVINLLTLIGSSLFLTILSSAAEHDRCRLSVCLHRTWQAAFHISGILLVVVLAVVLAGFPIITALVLGATIVPGTAVLLFIVGFSLVFWIYLYTGFAIEATLISGVGPIVAIKRSVGMVRHNFLPALGLLLLSFFIMSGLGVIWQALAQSTPGLIIAMGGSAYIGSGLAAARLVFYRERWAIGSWPSG